VAVVRDDLLKGGTKQRAAIPFLRHMMEKGVEEFVYASPFSGYAQIALARSCELAGAKCSIFAEKQNGFGSCFTASIAEIAKVKLFDTLAEAESSSKKYAESDPRRYKIPLGFNDPVYRECLQNELAKQWQILCDKLGFIPSRLWVPVGSGTLANVFYNILCNTQLVCVDVGVLHRFDQRIKKIKSLKNAIYIRTPESFSERADFIPPIPSNLFYDAKLWQFIEANAKPGDVWWNVAG
jgi:hypothetical protein